MIILEKTIIFEGKTTAEAIEKGLKELNISREQAEIKVLEEKKKSFFSILDPHVVRVEISVKEGVSTEKIEKADKKNEDEIIIPDEILENAKKIAGDFIKELIFKISESIRYEVIKKDNSILINIGGEGSAKLIGYRGEALNSLQIIVSSIIKNKVKNSVRVIIDVEGYRDRREKTLEELASKLERTVVKNGKSITLEPMSPYERKIIHTALQNSSKVKTHSIGEGNHRRIVVSKK